MSFKKANIKFTNPETDAQFVSLTPVDQFVEVPARKGAGQCYRGMLSNINPQAAERMIRFVTNLIQRKEPAQIDSGAGGGSNENNEQTS